MCATCRARLARLLLNSRERPLTTGVSLAPLADVEGLDKASLNVAVWSGNVTLTDVVLSLIEGGYNPPPGPGWLT